MLKTDLNIPYDFVTVKTFFERELTRRIVTQKLFRTYARNM